MSLLAGLFYGVGCLIDWLIQKQKSKEAHT